MVLKNEEKTHELKKENNIANISTKSNLKIISISKFTNENHILSINKITKSLHRIIILLFLITNLPACNGQTNNNTYNSSFDFSTKNIEQRLSKLQNHSLHLFNLSFSNITDLLKQNTTSDLNSLKKKAQDLCLELKTKLIETNQNYTLITSIFPSFITGIRSIFKSLLNATNLAKTKTASAATTTTANSTSVIYFEFLNEEAVYTPMTNLRTIDGSYNYTIDNIYHIFPVFTIVLFAFLSAAIFNCLYCNYCYCCAFRFTTKVRNKRFFHKITIFLIILSVLFLVLFVILQQRVFQMTIYKNYLTCELINKKIITFISNQDYTKDFVKEETDSKGLIQLRDNLNVDFKSEMTKVKSAVDNAVLITNKSPLIDEKGNLTAGINSFKKYVESNNFTFSDPNNNEKNSGFNITYKCESCKTLGVEVQNASNFNFIFLI